MSKSEIRPDLFYTMRDSADAAATSPSTVRNDFDAGKVKGVRLSDGQRVIPGYNLAEYVERRASAA